ncbi:PKD domain-containing protein [Chitinophaga sp.]|uniref:lectin-like domain-containing protein n=1 Tax=Chitinophaga sp. TaxID=1869181 RepID=UPI0031E3E1E5
MSCILFLYGSVPAQLQQPYILNGAATQRTCNCYVLTEDVRNTSGTVWNKNKIDLTQSFNYVFDVNLGCKDGNGADGIGFILQTQGTNLGATGQGLGFDGISPSLGILIDTWQNRDENDPPWDHLAIQMNGESDHQQPQNLAGPVTVTAASENIEDCNWHLFRIKWDATAKTLEVSVDGEVRLTLQKDIVQDIFGNDPLVYWGFAGSTGGSSNVQQFCAALRPAYAFDGGQILCDGTPVKFLDNSSSFGVITRRHWDLGDGTISSDAQPAPHLYAAPGLYDVKLVIEDNSGCISDTLKSTVTIGSYPVADFKPEQLCLGEPLQMKDASAVSVGTLQTWRWNWGNGQTAAVQHPVAPYTAPGSYNVELEVVSKEGCASKVSKPLQVFASPDVSATARNVCIGEAVEFKGINETPAVNIAQWYWAFEAGDTLRSQNVSYTYSAGGKHTARLHAVSSDGCAATADTSVAVIDLQLFAGRDTMVAKGQPLQLNAKANGEGLHYSWQPATGLTNPNIADPVARLEKDQVFRVTVSSPEGCRDEDDIAVKAYTGPEFYVPTAFTPNNDGLNDRFRVVAPGVPQLDFFRVWDRWGREIFSARSLEQYWDGTLNGRPAAAGTYVWMVQGVDYEGRRFSHQGTVTLIR